MKNNSIGRTTRTILSRLIAVPAYPIVLVSILLVMLGAVLATALLNIMAPFRFLFGMAHEVWSGTRECLDQVFGLIQHDRRSSDQVQCGGRRGEGGEVTERATH